MLVVLEGLFLLVILLVIGWAVDGLIKGRIGGLIHLVAVCLLLLEVGADRRFYDRRVYSGIYRRMGMKPVAVGP